MKVHSVIEMIDGAIYSHLYMNESDAIAAYRSFVDQNNVEFDTSEENDDASKGWSAGDYCGYDIILQLNVEVLGS